jgi:hypothetical protein
MKLVQLIKWLKETYKKVCIVKYLIHFLFRMVTAFPFCFKNAIRKVQEDQDGFEFNRTHQLLVYADHVSIVGENINIVRKKHIG